MPISSPNRMFDQLLESSHRDDSNKWSNIGFAEGLIQVESIEVHSTPLVWSSGSYMGLLYTVDSRYLELGYLEFCETRNVFLNQKYILIALTNHNLASDTFLKSKLPEVQINLHFG